MRKPCRWLARIGCDLAGQLHAKSALPATQQKVFTMGLYNHLKEKLRAWKTSAKPAATEAPHAPQTPGRDRLAGEDADALFGFQLLGQLAAAEESGQGNLLIGPRNIRTALAAVALGAQGETRREIIAQTGDYDSIDLAAGKSFTNALHIWLPPDKTLRRQFAGHFPHARIENTPVDQAPKAINAYVNEKTRGKIKTILDLPPAEDGMVLTTALDFESGWRTPFDLKDTRVDTFFVTPDEPQKTHFMSLDDCFWYSATPDGQIVWLPYRDDDLGMTIFLPRPDLNLAHWLEQGQGTNWQNAIDAMQLKEGNVKLPRVAFDFSARLANALQALGIRSAFTDTAEFDDILENPGPLKISDVRHKTRIQIDEQGTQAAAATSEVLLSAAADDAQSVQPPFSMHIDRPFFLTIGDAYNRKILFMGIVRQPSLEK
ncbi:MAG: hypothetical protein LBP52_02050 [Burkholderiaceae bacterium]|nr:hypothetical protein [Burkholderiaceae bacterium]